MRRCATAIGLLTVAVAGPARSAVAQVRAADSADVKFMQGMISHHAQALAMVALIPERTTRSEIQLSGQRIKISQTDEIKLMQHWLEDHHQAVPVVDSSGSAHMADNSMPGMDMGGAAMIMPGMLTPEQMTQLKQAKGPAFDRLFLTDMIQHHEGAIAMVKSLLATPGAAQAPEVFTFASEADADQRAEIKRMRSVLDTMANEGHKS